MTMSNNKAPTIAIDFDDVLVATNEAAATWHNREYGTSISLSHFYYYHWWKNPGWGSIAMTAAKVERFYASSDFRDAPPVKHALLGCQALKGSGYRLVIVTARSDEYRAVTEAAIARYFPGIFERVHYTACIGGRGTSYLTKPQILRQVGALLMIDDSFNNALDCANAGIPTLLFGRYSWNQRPSTMISPVDKLGFDQRAGVEEPNVQWWLKDNVAESELPLNIRRVGSWDAVLKAVKELL